MFENLDIKDIILGILVLLVIYLIYKTRNLSENLEKFGSTTTPAPTVSSIVKQAIADTYKVDLDAMRNLGGIANKILTNNDTLTIPATNLNYRNNDIRNYLNCVYLYVQELLLESKGDNVPISLPIGKINLITPARISSLTGTIYTRLSGQVLILLIPLSKIVINSGFRIKCWTGIFNNLNVDNTLNSGGNFDSKYYSSPYGANTPAIIENNTNSPLTIISPFNENGISVPLTLNIKSIEIELL